MADGFYCKHCGHCETHHGYVDIPEEDKNELEDGYEKSLKQCMTEGLGFEIRDEDLDNARKIHKELAEDEFLKIKRDKLLPENFTFEDYYEPPDH